MAQSPAAATAHRLTLVEWVICAIAAIGFAFDTYALLVLPLIVGPALTDLAHLKPGTPEFNSWVGLLFYVPAVAGGIFGLLGGYLTDLLGRRRILVWSILLYAFSALASGYATSAGMLLALRCTTFIGVSVEFVAAVAWLAELFPDAKQRESVLGYTQAFSSIGGLLISGAYGFAATHSNSWPAIYGGHEAWRYTLISGLIPAIPLIVIRPFLPESPVWQEKKLRGTLERPSIAELFRPEYRRTTLVTTLMFACSYGAAFGAIQHIPRIVPGLPQVLHLARPVQQHIVANVQLLQETGGLLGRVILAFLAIRIVSRRLLLRVFQLPGLFLVPFVFLYPAVHDLGMVKIGIFLAGLLTVAQFSFWGNYLPRMYPTHLRGTGESFAANIGGRMIGTSAALLTTQLANVMPGLTPFTKLAYAASAVALLVYAVGFVSSFWLPEPSQDKLPE
ncbi:MAG TPA: MFS transporter [Bryobacteraceae bacterium]|jgi:MFS family permease|nr:MFS transporter [Bryobacteraceae bacterium]